MLYVLQFANRFSGILLSMFVTRVLSVSDYGVCVLVFSVLSIFSLLCDFGTSDAILTFVPRMDREKDAQAIGNLVSTAFFFRLSLGLVVSAIFFLAADPIGHGFYPKIPQMSSLLRLVAFIPFLDPVTSPMTSLLLVYKRFRTVFLVGMVTVFFKVAFVSIFVWFMRNALGMVIASALVTVLTALIYWAIGVLYYRHILLSLSVFDHGMGEFRQQLRKLVSFGGFLTLNNLTYLVREQAKSLLTGATLGPSSTALFNRAAVLADMPIDAASAIRGAVVPFFAEGTAKGREILQYRYLYVTRLTILYASLITIVMMLFSQEIITLFYSRKFQDASPLLALLASAEIVRVVGIPLVSLLTALGETLTLAYVGFGFTTFLIILIAVITPRFGLNGLAASVVVYYIIIVPIFAWIAKHKVNIAFRYRLLAWPLLSVTGGLLVAYLLSLLGLHHLAAKLLGMAVFGLLFINCCVEDEDLELLRMLMTKLPPFSRPIGTLIHILERLRFIRLERVMPNA